MMISIQYWFVIFAVSQGALVLGMTIFVFFYYLPKTRTELHDHFRWWKMAAAASYIMLTFATIQTATIQAWSWGDFWYWCVTGGYVIGDAAVIILFRDAVIRRHRKELNKN